MFKILENTPFETCLNHIFATNFDNFALHITIKKLNEKNFLESLGSFLRELRMWKFLNHVLFDYLNLWGEAVLTSSYLII